MRIGLRGRLPILLGVPIAITAALGVARPTTTFASSSSSQVAYLTDSSNGGSNLWSDGLGVTPPSDGGSYSTHTPAPALTVTIHNIDVSVLDTPGSTALANIDTVVLFAACDIGNHPQAMKALNSFFDAGKKIVIIDGVACTGDNFGVADYSKFENPFSTNSGSVPQFQSAPYTFVESSTLTGNLPDCSPAPGCKEANNSVSDASTLSPNSDGWCKALGGTNVNNIKGPVMAYSRSKNGTGLAVYEGEAFASASQPSAHLRLVFDDMLTQAWNADGLACSQPSKSLSLTPATDSTFEGLNETLTAKVTDGSGNPVSGVACTFTVQSGPNAGTTGSGTTDSSGNATFTYTSSKAGTDAVVASFNDGDDHVSNPSNVTWQQSPPPPIAETHLAVAVPVIGLVLLAGLMLLTVVRHRRRPTAG